jgi:Rrf2 family protein
LNGFVEYLGWLPMKLSVRGEYALRALTHLGLHYGPEVVRIQAVADEENIPKRFLEQILNELRNGRFVESRRGVSGGYRLAASPEKIQLAAVIRHVEGALAPVGCVSEKFYEKCNCPDESRCALRSVMKEVRDSIAGILEKRTVADLVTRAIELKSQPMGADDFVI